MDINARLSELARIKEVPTAVVSVYLNTRWADEHQRERVRVFLKNEVRRARRGDRGRELDADLEWIQTQGESLVAQTLFPEAEGVALFACRAVGLREVIPVRASFDDTFVIAERPFLHPLTALLDQAPRALVVFVDGESARLIPVGLEGPGEEVTLQSEVPGHHRRGGWAQLAQSRYQRHIQDHRGRHFEAVAQTLVQLTEDNGVRRIVMAGEPRTITALEKHVPPRIAKRIVGIIAGARHESASILASRATELLVHLRGGEEVGAVDAVLTEAAKSRQAVAGLDEALEAVTRGAVHRLYVLKGFGEVGRVCLECRALQRGDGGTCRLCDGATQAAELGEAIVGRVLATGGSVETVELHQGLARVGGVAALLRYAL